MRVLRRTRPENRAASWVPRRALALLCCPLSERVNFLRGSADKRDKLSLHRLELQLGRLRDLLASKEVVGLLVTDVNHL